MWQGAKLIPLARNPYLARVICTLHRRQQMPSNRAELYQAFVTDLIEREQGHAAACGQSFPRRERLEDFLTGLANQMQAVQTTVLNRDQISSDAALLQAALDATILTQEGETLRFTHQLMQEIFAAKTLALKMYADADPRPLLGETWWQLNVWRETGLMLAEFSGDMERAARWLGQASPELGVEIVQRLQGDSLSAETRDSLIASANAKTDEINPVGRAAMYRALGILKADTRTGVGLRADGLPDIDWVEIPGGEFIYGDDNKADYPNYAKPADRQVLQLPTFRISRYPITYVQFQAFIDDPQGFYNPEWWQGLSADDDDKRQPGEQRFKFWNHPRENVILYDAIAFCRWLSAKLGYTVTLPTEQQWEKSARGTDGRIYPYGNNFDAAKGNTDETGIGQTSPVGMFPNGASPYGVLDMSGNVWEWCLSKYDKPERTQFKGSEWRGLRGGSWNNFQDFARAASCVINQLNIRNDSVGFRVVCRPPSPVAEGSSANYS